MKHGIFRGRAFAVTAALATLVPAAMAFGQQQASSPLVGNGSVSQPPMGQQFNPQQHGGSGAVMGGKPIGGDRMGGGMGQQGRKVGSPRWVWAAAISSFL